MKKILLVSATLALASSAWSAQGNSQGALEQVLFFQEEWLMTPVTNYIYFAAKEAGGQGYTGTDVWVYRLKGGKSGKLPTGNAKTASGTGRFVQ